MCLLIFIRLFGFICAIFASAYDLQIWQKWKHRDLALAVYLSKLKLNNSYAYFTVTRDLALLKPMSCLYIKISKQHIRYWRTVHVIQKKGTYLYSITEQMLCTLKVKFSHGMIIVHIFLVCHFLKRFYTVRVLHIYTPLVRKQ